MKAKQMIISFHSIDQETAEPHHFLIDWIKGYWSNTQRCKMFFYSKAEKKTCNTYWEKSNCLIIEILRHKPTNFDIKSLSLNQSEWITDKVTFELSWTGKKRIRGLGNMFVPVHLIWDVHHSLSTQMQIFLWVNMQIISSANNQTWNVWDYFCFQKFGTGISEIFLKNAWNHSCDSYLKVCWGKSENSWKLNWVCWNV